MNICVKYKTVVMDYWMKNIDYNWLWIVIKHTHTHIYIYIYIYIWGVRGVMVIVGNGYFT